MYHLLTRNGNCHTVLIGPEISKQIYTLSYVHQEVWNTFANDFFMEYLLFILSLTLNSIQVVLQKSTTWIFFKSSILMKDNARHLVTQKSFWEFHHVVNNIVVWAGPRERVESSLAQLRHSRPKASVAAVMSILHMQVNSYQCNFFLERLLGRPKELYLRHETLFKSMWWIEVNHCINIYGGVSSLPFPK